MLVEVTPALQGTGDSYNHIISSSFAILCNHVRLLFADKERRMTRETAIRKAETPEREASVLERNLDQLKAEIDRLNWEIRLKDLQIEVLRKENERLNKEQNK